MFTKVYNKNWGLHVGNIPQTVIYIVFIFPKINIIEIENLLQMGIKLSLVFAKICFKFLSLLGFSAFYHKKHWKLRFWPSLWVRSTQTPVKIYNIGVTVHKYIRCASKPWCNIVHFMKGKKENQEIPTWATTTKTCIFRKKTLLVGYMVICTNEKKIFQTNLTIIRRRPTVSKNPLID